MPSKGPIVLPAIAADDDLGPFPIDPSWMVAGTPTTRARRLMLVDDSALSGTLWETTAAQFEWHYGSDELVMIVDGEVVITPPSGSTFTLRKGDVMFVSAGQVLSWNVPVFVKKLVVNPVHTPLVRRLAVRIPFARSLVRRLRMVRGQA
jgi:uncharacterized cupin superfamily protein